MTCFIGVDVGTNSARAGVFARDGTLLGSAKHPIALYLDPGDVAEHSSDDIWRAVSASVASAVRLSGVDAATVGGIGFDATCSLVVVGAGGRPLPVGHADRPDRNVIVWMDHRATEEARRINGGKHPVLDYVGGAISPEMQTPKLMWLKANRPATFANAVHFFDLTDYLTWRATGSDTRSLCTVTCKWTYIAQDRRWDETYFRSIGLGELADEGFSRIGQDVVAPGTRLGSGLTAEAARDFGLPVATPVGAGLIDAHAGGLATVGARGGKGPITARMGYVCGTSACSMLSSARPISVRGVWGPYYAAMMPGLWLNEGGQSAAGAAIDHLVRLHPAHGTLAEEPAQIAAVDLLADLAVKRVDRLSDAVRLAGGVHVVPEFLGNRSPLADPDARAVIAGLDLSETIESLIALYVAGLCGIGYGARQLIAACAERGIKIGSIVVSGGMARSHLVRQLIADTTGIEVAAVASEEPVLLGAAMLGAVAAGACPSLDAAAESMSRLDTFYRPAAGEIAALHDARFAAYEALQDTERRIRG